MVKNLLSLLSARQSSILSGASILMIMMGASKIFGLIRLRLIAHYFTSEQSAVFWAAFRIPDLLFQILIFGAVSVAFIPVFTDLLHRRGDQQAFDFASDILNTVLVGFVLVSVLVIIFALPLTYLAVPGFTPEQKEITASLTRIIMLGQILLVIGSFFASISQSYQRFIIPAFAATMYNIGIILGILLMVRNFGIFAPALGVIIGATLHVLIQLPLVTSLGFQYKIRFNILGEGIREVFRLMSFRTIGVAAEQINETIGILLASLISTSSVTYLTYAMSLQTFPISLFGLTLAQAALPVLSTEQSKDDTNSFKITLLTTLHQILFLTLPAAAILVVLRIPVVRLVFGASKFDWNATVLTGRTLAFLAIGLSAQALSMLLVRAFYALKNTKTPVIISVVTVVINIILSIMLVTVAHQDIWSIGLAYSLSASTSVLLLIISLSKKLGGFSFRQLYLPALKMFIAAVISAVAIYIPIKLLDQLVFDTTRTINLIMLTGIASIFGLSVYLLLVWLLKVKELETFGNLIKRIYNLDWAVKSEEIVSPTETV